MNPIDEQFDPNIYLDTLIKAMHFENEVPEKVTELKENLGLSLHHAIFNAASEALEPEVIDQVIEEIGDEKNLMDFVVKLIKRSPAAQKAIVAAIDQFTQETLEDYEHMVKAN